GGADGAYSFETTPGQLPKNVVPVHYAIDLRPNLDKLTLAGSVAIDIEVREATDRFVLNAVGMSFGAAVIEGIGRARDIAIDEHAQTVTLTFPRPIEAGQYTLRLAYTAPINKFGRGVYSIDYPTDGGRRRMIAS